MKILLATHNVSKLERYKKILKAIDFIELVSLADLNITEKVEENHETNTENALHKARTYGKISGLTTVAIDEALMTNFLPDNEQPGVYARRLNKDKKELTDKEVIETWKKIFKLYPQEDKQFIWSFAIAFYNPANNSEGVKCIQQISYIAKYFSTLGTNGYPMSTFLSSTKNGNPYIEMGQKEKDEKDNKNFRALIREFKKWIAIQIKLT
jgi:inosine/xanthosine triphosphate pyrophosphatase family protein